MIRLKKNLNPLACLCLTTMMLIGCGEMFQQEWPEEYDPETLPDVTGLGGDDGSSFTLYVGDEYTLDPQVGEYLLSQMPEEAQEIVLSRFHARTNWGDSIVRVRQTSLRAMSVGKDTIRFTNSEGDWSTSCPVAVMPVWTKQRMAGWRYETIVYAQVTANGTPVPNDVMLAALCDGQLRGRGVTRTVKGVTYTVFRIGSNTASGDVIRFEGYDPTQICPITFSETLSFDGATHGTLSDLFELKGKK